MLKIIDLLPSWRKEHYYSEIGKIVLGRDTEYEKLMALYKDEE